MALDENVYSFEPNVEDFFPPLRALATAKIKAKALISDE